MIPEGNISKTSERSAIAPLPDSQGGLALVIVLISVTTIVHLLQIASDVEAQSMSILTIIAFDNIL